MQKSYNGLSLPNGGEAIQYADGKYKIPDHPIIPFIEGDGIGRDGRRSTWGYPSFIDSTARMSVRAQAPTCWARADIQAAGADMLGTRRHSARRRRHAGHSTDDCPEDPDHNQG